jgi:chromosome condensin MukBEF complex kleisin-like MukF subunit
LRSHTILSVAVNDTVNDTVRANALARIKTVQALVHDLPRGGPIAAVLTDDYLQEQRAWVEAETDLVQAEWPPLLGWTRRRRVPSRGT